MRFIKFNFFEGGAFVFSLDHLFTLKSEGRDTAITLTDGSSETLTIDIDDLCNRIFSDEHGINEYQLIEIDNERPMPAQGI